MSISRKFATGSFYSVLGTGANNMAGFLVFVVLARLLDPASIGLVAFAIIFVELGKVVVFGGLPEAIIQRKEWDHDVASTCFIANLLSAALFVLVMIGIAAPLLSTYYAAGSGMVLSALSSILVIDAARAIHEAKLKRTFNYKLLATRGAIATLLSGIVGIALAYGGFGVWALVAQRLMSSVLITLLTWRAAKWRPSPRLSWSTLRSMSGFATHMTLARLLAVFGVKLPEFIVGLFLGPAMIGFYRIGARGLEAISQLTVNPIREAALSAFSRLPDAKVIGSAYLRVTRVTAFVACPVYIGAAVTAQDVVLLVFGPQWQPSGIIMAAIALGIGALSFAFFLQTAMTAAGRTGTVLGTSIGGFLAILGVSLAAVPFGLTAVAVANTLRNYLSLPFWLAVLRNTLNVPWKEAALSVLPAFLAALVMGTAVLSLHWQLPAGMHPIPRTALSIALGAFVYTATLLVFARRYLKTIRAELMPLLPQRIRKLLGA